MKNGRKTIAFVICIVIGVVLWALWFADLVDEFWSGMGSGLIAVGVLRLIQVLRLRKDEAYREKVEVETADERNRFLRSKAWAWAGYLFILIMAVSIIVLKVIGQDLLCQAASYAVCLLLLLYWVSYMVLRKKY